MKKILSNNTKEKVTDAIISILSKNDFTFSDFQEISKSVTKIYCDNAVLRIASSNDIYTENQNHHHQQ